jgi:hypothetical protein
LVLLGVAWAKLSFPAAFRRRRISRYFEPQHEKYVILSTEIAFCTPSNFPISSPWASTVFVAVFDLVCPHSMIAMMSHERSWVYKWQRMKRASIHYTQAPQFYFFGLTLLHCAATYRPGCYAVKVDGYVNVTQQDDDMGLGGDDDAQ